MASSSVVPQPWIAFGTGTALYGRDAADQVKVAIDSGFRHLDGAQSYSNEESLGKGITLSGVPREKLYITTKLGGLQEGETVKQSLEKSLAKLGVEQVDLFLVHSPSNHKGNLSKVWDGMVEVKQLGLTKSIGVSNFSISNLKEITQGRDETDYPVLNQIEYHPYLFKSEAGLLEFHAQKNIITSSYGGLSPLFRKTGGPVDAVVAKISERFGEINGKRRVSEVQVLLKWLQAKRILIVTTSSKDYRLKEYLESLNDPALTPDDVKEIDEAGSQLHYRKFGSFESLSV